MSVTAEERLDASITYSDKVYRAIDEVINGESRARSIIRLGLAVVSRELEDSYGDGMIAGDYVHALLWDNLRSGGITEDDVSFWPQYKNILRDLPRSPLSVIDDLELDTLSSRYADVPRITLTNDGSLETDGRHVVHLMALALPYAAEFFPDLDQSKIAIYCLIHDILEVYSGDVNTLGAPEEQLAAKNDKEHQSLLRIKAEIGQRYPRLIQMINDYENLADDEAKFVKTFDKLDPGFTHLYSDGRVITERIGITSEGQYHESVDAITQRMLSYARNFPQLLDDRVALTKRVIGVITWAE